MFERYTDRARRSVVLARAQARTMGHAEVGTGHLLLGLATEEGGIASLCLFRLGLDFIYARSRLAAASPSTRIASPPDIPFTPGLRKAMENALRESAEMGDPYIGTEHLLLGLLGDAEGPAGGILAAAGLTPLAVRKEVMRRLGTYEQSRVPAPEDVNHHRRLATVPASALPPYPWRYRTGISNPWSLYVVVPGDDRKADLFAGHLETEGLAAMAVAALNAAAGGTQ